jgi:oxygen-independent coproporphyrinogen-3 oxidase
MNNVSSDWLAEWKKLYPKEMYSWNAQYPDIDREYVTFYPCDVRYLDGNKILTEDGRMRKENIHLYVHIPFCKYICPFCFFNKYPFDATEAEIYIKCLKEEIYYYSKKPYLQNSHVISIYFGGGTPTVLSPIELTEIIHHIKEHYSISNNAEITVESNPLTIRKDVAEKLVANGVNRISIGVQSFNNNNLKRLHLLHRGEECVKLIKQLKSLGIRVGIDLMYRLPGETISDWERDLSTAVNLDVDTISCYSLELPPSVKERVFSDISLPNVEEDIKMYYFAIDYLKEHGYKQYTIADFSLPGKESSYVMNCWKAPQHEYLGFGAGAHSFIGGYVFYNIASLKYYTEWVKKKQLPILFGKKLTKEELMSRYFVLGVKTLSVDLRKFEQIFGINPMELYGNVINDLVNKNLIQIKGTLLKLTRKGLIYVDNISKSFYTENNKGRPQPVGILLQEKKPQDFMVIK